jgi:hypothetical protein
MLSDHDANLQCLRHSILIIDNEGVSIRMTTRTMHALEHVFRVMRKLYSQANLMMQLK